MAARCESIHDSDNSAYLAPVLDVGDVVENRYRVEALLTGGAMGSLYRCLDFDLERACCIKLLKRSGSLTAREELRHEAAALATLRHEHVVGVYAFGVHEHRPYFVMEYVRGRNLGELIEEHYGEHRTPIPLTRAIQLLRTLCDGVAAVHSAGMIHRDIKPANVIVEDRTGRLVLADFGAAVVARRWNGTVVGTPHYMPPEAFQGSTPTAQMDLYSVGCLAYELLTGTPPFEGQSMEELREQHLNSAPPPISSRRSELAPYDTLMERLLAKDPAKRPVSAVLLANQFDARKTVLPAGGGPVSEVLASQDGLRILVVDDDPTFARMAARCVQVALPETLVSVSRAGTGALAISNALARPPDLIVLDYQLPDTTGVEVLSEIRARHGHHAEVLVASGALSVNERWRFHILGVRDFVDKPIDFPTLVQTIHELAKRRAWVATVAHAP